MKRECFVCQAVKIVLSIIGGSPVTTQPLADNLLTSTAATTPTESDAITTTGIHNEPHLITAIPISVQCCTHISIPSNLLSLWYGCTQLNYRHLQFAEGNSITTPPFATTSDRATTVPGQYHFQPQYLLRMALSHGPLFVQTLLLQLHDDC